MSLFDRCKRNHSHAANAVTKLVAIKATTAASTRRKKSSITNHKFVSSWPYSALSQRLHPHRATNTNNNGPRATLFTRHCCHRGNEKRELIVMLTPILIQTEEPAR